MDCSPAQIPTTRRRPDAAAGFYALCGYIVIASALTWPIALHLRTHLLADTSSDLSIYLWNIWIFRHELIEHGHIPFSTDHLFAYTDGIDFALHNYTPLAGLAGVPLITALGVVGTFNVILLVSIALTGLGAFVLSRRLGLGPVVSWCGGALFIASPAMTTRTADHFSVATAAALPFFMWSLLRVLDSLRKGDAVLAGVLVAVALYSDAYYGIYCVLIGVFLVAWRYVGVEHCRTQSRSRTAIHAVDVVGALITSIIIWRMLSGSTDAQIGSVHLGLQTLYTPVLMLVVTLAVRAWLAWRPVFVVRDPDHSLVKLVWLGMLAVAVCLALVLPMIIGVGMRYVNNRLPDAQLYWRSSPPGVDLLAYLIPNPIHPWFGGATRSWLSAATVGFPEFVASFSLVALACIAAAAVLGTLPRQWMAFSALAVMLSAGPFVHIAGFNTYVIGPWALLRYMPLIGLARSPSRFAVVAALGLSLLFAFGMAALARRCTPGWRRIAGALIAVGMAIELTPAPRVLY